MKFRKLRIAWSVGCGIACLLLIVLWVRSHSHADIVRSKLIKCEAISVRGRLKLTNDYFPGSPQYDSYAIGERAADVIDNHVRQYANPRGFGHLDRHSILIPHWFAALFIVPLAAIPWAIHRRFTLRTLLIATTLVAVVLGLIVYLTQQ